MHCGIWLRILQSFASKHIGAGTSRNPGVEAAQKFKGCSRKRGEPHACADIYTRKQHHPHA